MNRNKTFKRFKNKNNAILHGARCKKATLVAAKLLN